VLLGRTAEQLEGLGVKTLAVIGTSVEPVRLYLRFRPTRCLVGADPDLLTHQAYGVPRAPMSPEIWDAVESASVALARDLSLPVSGSLAHDAINRFDGYAVTEGDHADLERHQAQFTAQFLVDRDGIVRWANVEGARDGLAGIDRFPTDEEILAAARALGR
jgi:hypothetical protein